MTRTLILATLIGAAGAVALPKIDVHAKYRSEPVKLSESESQALKSGLEAVVVSCTAAHTPAPAKRHAELELNVHYASPQAMPLADARHRTLAVRDIVLDATSDVNEGWPVVYVVDGSEARQLDACDTARISAALCVAPLEHLSPLKVRERCRLTPR